MTRRVRKRDDSDKMASRIVLLSIAILGVPYSFAFVLNCNPSSKFQRLSTGLTTAHEKKYFGVCSLQSKHAVRILGGNKLFQKQKNAFCQATLARMLRPSTQLKLAGSSGVCNFSTRHNAVQSLIPKILQILQFGMGRVVRRRAPWFIFLCSSMHLFSSFHSMAGFLLVRFT